MKTIKKKIAPKYFKEVKAGIKDFEIRKDECGPDDKEKYEVGDILILQEWYPGDEDLKDNIKTYPFYTGNEITKRIKYKITAEEFPDGIQEVYCVLGLENINKQQFQLGDTAYCIDEDYRYFESTVKKIELYKERYYYSTEDCDFDLNDINDWVFTSELYRQIHMENMFGGDK